MVKECRDFIVSGTKMWGSATATCRTSNHAFFTGIGERRPLAADAIVVRADE